MTTTVKERPIIMSGESVRAILEGRKTQTRRVVKPQPPSVEAVRTASGSGFHLADSGQWGGTPGSWRICGPVAITCEIAGLPNSHAWRCPYGVPGDRVWVRETWAPFVRGDGGEGWVELLRWRADEAEYPVPPEHSADWGRLCEKGYHWRSPIFMPRWASRLLLEVTDVRVERLQEICELECYAEGVSDALTTDPDDHMERVIEDFREAWDTLNAKRGHGWETDPWVWVVSFRRVSP